jgi:hypothetical protein
MAVVVPNCGTYMVEMDYGSTTNAFRLDDAVAGVLNSTTYVLDGTPLYVDVTTYVKSVSINRGRQNRYRDATGQPGSATIILEDRDFYFSLVNTGSPYYNATQARLGFELNSNVRISRNGTYLFVGIISQYNQSIEKPNRSLVTISCSDKLFGLNNVKTPAFTPVVEYAGSRINKVLTNAGLFSGATDRDIVTGVAKLGTAAVDESASVLEYLQRINNSEQGRIFIKANGAFAFDQRLTGEFQAIEATLADTGGTAIPFTEFDIVSN